MRSPPTANQNIAGSNLLRRSAQSGSARGRSRGYPANQQTAGLGQPQLLGPIAGDQIGRNADGARSRPLSGLEIAQHPFGAVDRHRETDADAAAVGTVDGRIDPDHVALRIEQRPAAVAGVNGRVGLDHVLQIAAFLALDFAVQRAHDAGGQGSREAERIADRQHLLPHLQAVRNRPA